MTEHSAKLERKPVWDIYVRLFHWTLAASILFAWWTSEQGGNWMSWHMYAGYTVLGLVLFRLMWGFAGSHHARFSEFVRSPITTARYALQMLQRREPHHLGHNPLGGWMVVALLLLAAAQASTGLFANDEIITEGPLVHLISYDLSVEITRWHKWLFDILLIAIGLHLLGVIYHQLFKREKLVQAMLHGRKPASADAPSYPFAPFLRGLLLALVAAAIVWNLLNLL
ncbi:cytochrome b/b6 domain-containing protein [Marinobacterium iners]|uniref:Cytochrome b n=1 Tax=Marinobacterium iners DSM 11526 TaxID=1122198 RepID=A0A1H4GU32_9GAMM|nr:cytochrome b/b6 domain-containing protein [Marinobacterium iners]SEB13146.1 Cytochrome b [Marinobacterium iners DSM 11526]